ncbi:cytochrome P450 2U1-like [Amphiura filiformis]|uniref:cytochrome P450 2U1-like n=1 Tax=Amphiura filiformis TaxID=82378 RepID=UPI003B21F36E
MLLFDFMFSETLNASLVQSSLVCLATFSAIIWWLRPSRSRSLPPGPRGWPILGYLPNIKFSEWCNGYQTHDVMCKLAEKYGAVFGLKIGSKDVLVLNDYESIKEAFHHTNMNDRPENAMIKNIDNLGTGILFSCGDKWKEIRKFTITKLKSFGIGKRSFAENITIEAECLNSEIAKIQGNPFYSRPLLEPATLNVISSILLGQRFSYDDEELHFILDNLHRNGKVVGSGGALLFVPSLQIFLKDKIKEYRHNLDVVLKYFRGIVSKHQEEFDPYIEKDYIDAYISEMRHNKDKGKQSYLDVSNLVMTLGNLFAAGSFTTSETLSWAILYLTKHPEIQKRAQEEIDNVLNQNQPRLEDKPSLPYTWAVVLETMRLATVGPLGVTHAVADDTRMFGCEIPKGTMIMPNLWNVHHDPALWSEPNEFKPERFLNENGQVEEPPQLIPFGTGRRSCPGEQLGKMELFIFITHLLQKFNFKEAEGESPLTLEGSLGLTWSPTPYHVCAHSRE